MTHKVLLDILTNHGGCRKEGDAVIVPEGTELSLFSSLGAEPLIVARVTRLVLADDFLVATTAKRERFALAYEDIRSVRLAGNTPSAGYET